MKKWKREDVIAAIFWLLFLIALIVGIIVIYKAITEPEIIFIFRDMVGN
jgi:paraquat-inducible protein B